MADLTGMMQAAAGAGGGGIPYIEDVFSTYLYTGTGAALTITNDIDLDGEGGLVWIKSRSAATSNFLFDTERGVTDEINSDSTGAEASLADSLTAFNSNGFSISSATGIGVSAATYVSWTFRKQPKFFDIVTYTGTGVARTIAHNLDSVPGMMIIKRLNTSTNWPVYHRSLAATEYMILNGTSEVNADSGAFWNSTRPTSTVFSLGDNANVNGSGDTYVAYLFAHDAGGFGLTGEDNVISCGSYVGNGIANGPVVNLGYEPQWLLVKNTSITGDWFLMDNMRGIPMSGDTRILKANTSDAEDNNQGHAIELNATGFKVTGEFTGVNGDGNTHIYIACRRGPMAVPELGTSVFGLSARTGTGADATVTGSAGVSDAVLVKNRGSAVASLFSSRLTSTGYLVTSTTAAEVAAATTILQANPWDVMDGVKVGTTSTITNASANTYINYLFDRAPGFFDVVCYTGTGSARTVTHNLAVVPELMIVKRRSTSGSSWAVYATALGNAARLELDTTGAVLNVTGVWNNTTPTASVFSIGTPVQVNQSGETYVNYLFATLAGVSKVGSYTGTAAAQTINCGFTAGARFILIKRTDNTGDWYVWDTARGIIAGDDPYWLTNSDAAEVTNTDYIDTAATGFELTSTAPAAINASGGTYIFLAIA
jgi:hypothetical protein